MKAALIIKICPAKFYYLMMYFINLIFFKKYGTLHSLLKDLVTRKMTINSANADQISFIIDLMMDMMRVN